MVWSMDNVNNIALILNIQILSWKINLNSGSRLSYFEI